MCDLPVRFAIGQVHILSSSEISERDGVNIMKRIVENLYNAAVILTATILLSLFCIQACAENIIATPLTNKVDASHDLTISVDKSPNNTISVSEVAVCLSSSDVTLNISGDGVPLVIKTSGNDADGIKISSDCSGKIISNTGLSIDSTGGNSTNAIDIESVTVGNLYVSGDVKAHTDSASAIYLNNNSSIDINGNLGIKTSSTKPAILIGDVGTHDFTVEGSTEIKTTGSGSSGLAIAGGTASMGGLSFNVAGNGINSAGGSTDITVSGDYNKIKAGGTGISVDKGIVTVKKNASSDELVINSGKDGVYVTKGGKFASDASVDVALTGIGSYGVRVMPGSSAAGISGGLKVSSTALSSGGIYNEGDAIKVGGVSIDVQGPGVNTFGGTTTITTAGNG